MAIAEQALFSKITDIARSYYYPVLFLKLWVMSDRNNLARIYSQWYRRERSEDA